MVAEGWDFQEVEGFELVDGPGAGARGEGRELGEAGHGDSGVEAVVGGVDVGEEHEVEFGGVGGEFWE